MFAIPIARIAELSRPDYARETAEYARLEYPHEDARTVILQAIAAAEDRPAPSRRWFRLSRSTPTATDAVPAKA
jgi:hypothetical protein